MKMLCMTGLVLVMMVAGFGLMGCGGSTNAGHGAMSMPHADLYEPDFRDGLKNEDLPALKAIWVDSQQDLLTQFFNDHVQSSKNWESYTVDFIKDEMVTENGQSYVTFFIAISVKMRDIEEPLVSEHPAAMVPVGSQIKLKFGHAR